MNNEKKSMYSSDPRQLVPLWEEIGASTGGLIGRFIGLNFLMGARYLSFFLNPQGYYFNNNAGNNNIDKYYITIKTTEENKEVINNIILQNKGTLN